MPFFKPWLCLLDNRELQQSPNLRQAQVRSKHTKQILALFYDHLIHHKTCKESSNLDTIGHRFVYTALDKPGQEYAPASSLSTAAEVYTSPEEYAILPT
jgi:acetate kinase